jgi:membrane protein
MFVSFSLVYYFAPDIEERKWFWVTPGSVAGVVLWLLASIGFRFYLHFFNNYSATYGFLGAVVILMLWLYITGFAILIGGEVNWVIENEDRKTLSFAQQKQRIEQKIHAA